jgi:hypothetical protein
MNILIAFLIVLTLPAHPSDLFSVTGPSSANTQIVPIAFNDNGAILFKTYRYINRTGGYSSQRNEFGWLVVSSDGIWEEVRHIILAPEEWTGPHEDLWKQFFRYLGEFDRDFNWSSPPYSVRRLLKKYGFTSSQRISRNKGKGMIIWTPTRVCKAGKCPRGAIVQRSLRGLRNVRGEGGAIKCSFYYAGVALFKNHDGYDDKNPEGAYFFIRAPAYDGIKDLTVDEFSIDAISIIR